MLHFGGKSKEGNKERRKDAYSYLGEDKARGKEEISS